MNCGSGFLTCEERIPEALNALGDIYAEQENWPDLVDVLDREVSVAVEDSMRVMIYSDLGRIWYDKLDRDRNALDSWERVLDIAPAHTEALFAIAEIHRAAKQHHELVDTLNRIIEVGAATLDDAQLEHVYMQLGLPLRDAARTTAGMRSTLTAGHSTFIRATSRRWTRLSTFIATRRCGKRRFR